MPAILRIVLGLALLCAFSVDSWSQSQQPSAGVQKAKNDSRGKSESDQQDATKNQNATDDSPIVTIKVVGPKPNAAHGANENATKNENYPTDWPMFWATVGIACIGLLQLAAFIAQAIYIRVSAREMRKTTQAAEDVSKDQIAHSHQIERAYMSAGGGPQQGPTGRFQHLANGVVAQEIGPTDWFQFDVNNHGKTPGEILEYGYGWCEADKVSVLPHRPVYRWVEFRDQLGPGTQSRGIKRLKIPPNKPVIFGRIGIGISLAKAIPTDSFKTWESQLLPPIAPTLKPTLLGTCPMSGSGTIKKKNPRASAAAQERGADHQ